MITPAPAAQPSQLRSRSLIAHDGITPSIDGESRNPPRDTRKAETSRVFGGRLESTRRRVTSDQRYRQCVKVASCGEGIIAGQAGGGETKTGEKVNTTATRCTVTRCSSVFAESATRLNGGGNVDKGAGGGQVQVAMRRDLKTVKRRPPLQVAAQLGPYMPGHPPSVEVGDAFRWSNSNSTNAGSEGRREGAGGGDKENRSGAETTPSYDRGQLSR